MDKEIESKVEEILSIALKEEGRAYFKYTSLNREYHRLREVNSVLSMFGKIYGHLTNSTWSHFDISPYGIEFMDNGGFEGRKEQKDYKAKMEILNFEIAELQKKQLEYEKEIRYQERIIRIHKYFEAIIGITILIIYMLIRLFKY